MNNNIEKFNEYCGIAKVEDEEGNQIHVVYADAMECPDEILGSVIGKGLSKQEALTDAIKNIILFIKSCAERLENIKISEIEKLVSDLYCVELDKVVIPVETIETKYVNDKTEYIPSGKYVNANVYYSNIEKKPVLGMP